MSPSFDSTERPRREAFELEALPHHRSLLAASYRLTRRRQDAEDLVQETYLRAYRAFEQYTPGTNIRAWLFTILYRAHTDGLRRTARRPATVSLAYEPAGPTIDADFTSDQLVRALRRLPLGYRAALLLRDVEGCSYRDVSSRLRVPIGTVMSRLHRGRALLRRALASGRPEPKLAAEGHAGRAAVAAR